MFDHVYTIKQLSTVRRIGIIGDVRGDLDYLRAVSLTMRERGVKVLLQLGDLGFQNEDPGRCDLMWASEILAERSQTLVFVDGNIDRHRLIYSYPISPDGVRWLEPNIGALPRGYRTVLGGRHGFVALGGANGVYGRGRHPLESITADDLAAVGSEPAAIMVGHDAPSPFPALDRSLQKTDHFWTAEGLQYAAAGRAMLTRGITAVQPRLYLGSHFDRFLDEKVTFGEGANAFETRVVLMDSAGGHRRMSQAVLDTRNLELAPFHLGSA